MISLALTFVSGDGGYGPPPGPLTYVQVARTDKVAVYQRFYADGRPKDFETFKIKVNPKGMVQKFPNGVIKIVEDDTEKYPSTGQFGFIAWSFHNKGAAMARYEKLCKEADGIEDAPVEVVESVGETPVSKPPKEVKALLVPVGEFTVGELADKNSVNYVTAHLYVKSEIGKSIKFLRQERRNAKGKLSNIYSKTA